MSGPSRNPGGQPAGHPGADHAARAAGWVEHLRDGGTTPWPRWTGPGDSHEAAAGPSGDAAGTPGAAQLELLRRLNKLGPLPHRVDHVLTRPGPGRGPVHLPLPVAGRPAPRPEVLRVAAGVLADLTAELPPRKERRRRLRSPGRRGSAPEPVEGLPRFVLEGPPITVAEVGAQLAAVGMAPHQPRFSWLGARPDPGPELVVVLAGPLDDALREVWSSRVQRGAARPWPRFVTQWAGRRALPPSPALDRTVDYWSERLGAGQVHVVVAGTGADASSGVAEVLGRSLEPAAEPSQLPWRPDPARLAAPVVDALRRVNAVLPFVCSTADREPRLAALVQLARSDGGRWVPPDLPKRHRGWVRSNANRIADALRDSGAVVHGDLDSLRQIGPRTGHHVRGGEVLDAMIRMIHRVDAEIAAGPRGGRGGR